MGSKTAFGMILIAGGLAMVVGSSTGNLPAMLGALFDPSAIVTSSGNSSAVTKSSNLTQAIQSAMGAVVVPGSGLVKAFGL